MTYMVNQGGKTVTKFNLAATTAAATGLMLIAGAASAQEIRFMCYSDGNECEVYDDVLTRFEAENEGIDVIVDVVPYQAILENLPVQLAAGTGPDMAKVTDLGEITVSMIPTSPFARPVAFSCATFCFSFTSPTSSPTRSAKRLEGVCFAPARSSPIGSSRRGVTSRSLSISTWSTTTDRSA